MAQSLQEAADKLNAAAQKAEQAAKDAEHAGNNEQQQAAQQAAQQAEQAAQQAEQAAQQAQAAAKQPDDNGNKPANESIAGDPVEAYKWAVVARETAKTDKTKSAQVYRANRLLRQLAKKMNAEQVKQAEEAAQAFLNK